MKKNPLLCYWRYYGPFGNITVDLGRHMDKMTGYERSVFFQKLADAQEFLYKYTGDVIDLTLSEDINDKTCR